MSAANIQRRKRRAKPSASIVVASASSSTSSAWYDKHRKCMDGNKHEGRLELITWESPESDKDKTGWGNCFIEESAELKAKFESKYKSDEAKFYGYWPQGFRWTCCGGAGDNNQGCDHHGSGSTPCTCDFCQMGEPLPEKIFNKKTTENMGLTLRRGPDPRSRQNSAVIKMHQMMRGLLGCDLDTDSD